MLRMYVAKQTMWLNEESRGQNKSTLAGLEPTRENPNRFLVGRLNHSATVSFLLLSVTDNIGTHKYQLYRSFNALYFLLTFRFFFLQIVPSHAPHVHNTSIPTYYQHNNWHHLGRVKPMLRSSYLRQKKASYIKAFSNSTI